VDGKEIGNWKLEIFYNHEIERNLEPRLDDGNYWQIAIFPHSSEGETTSSRLQMNGFALIQPEICNSQYQIYNFQFSIILNIISNFISMKNKSLTFGAVILISSFLFSGCLPGGRQAVNQDDYSQQDNVKITTKIIKTETEDYLIDIRYPQIDNQDEIARYEKINQDILSKVNADRASFEGLMETMDWSPPDPNLSSSYHVDFTYTITDNKILSVALNGSSYAGGAAHPNNFTHTANYNLNTGNEILLNDLFKCRIVLPGVTGSAE